MVNTIKNRINTEEKFKQVLNIINPSLVSLLSDTYKTAANAEPAEITLTEPQYKRFKKLLDCRNLNNTEVLLKISLSVDKLTQTPIVFTDAGLLEKFLAKAKEQYKEEPFITELEAWLPEQEILVYDIKAFNALRNIKNNIVN